MEVAEGAQEYIHTIAILVDLVTDSVDAEASGYRAERLGGRRNASRMSHAELDESEVLDDGDPAELAADYASLKTMLPWLNVFGGCCGSDLRHVTAIAGAVRG